MITNQPHSAAIVTGASSGIGLAIARALLDEGYVVYGFGRTFREDAPKHPHFHALNIDLRDTVAVRRTVSDLPKEPTLSLLVNAAGVAYYGPHETLSPEAIHDMLAVNVEAPLLLTNLLLRDLKHCGGTILNVSSVTAKQSANTHGCAYGATKAALSAFSSSLFEECRKHNVRVITLHPDLTDTELYRNADFTPRDEADYRLTPEEVAGAALQALNARDGLVVTDITLRPQRNGIVRKEVH